MLHASVGNVSVVVPCHPPHVPYLSRLIYSLYQQTRLPKEIIISLSETNQETAIALERKLSDLIPVRILWDTAKHMAGENRNRGARVSTGKVISFIDADDVSHPQRLEIVEELFRRHNPKMLLHAYVKKTAVFQLYEIDQIALVHSPDIFRYTFGNPVQRERDKELAGTVVTNLVAGGGDCHIHHGHCSVAPEVMQQDQFTEFFPREDGIFARDVLLRHNNTLYAKADLTAYMS